MMHVDFVITNPNHHWTMVRPVLVRLLERGHTCRVLSLCEVRGHKTPASAWDMEGVSVRVIGERLRRRGSSAPGPSAVRPNGIKLSAAWSLVIGPAFQRAIRAREPDVVVLPHDGNFPGRRLVEMLHRRGIPSVLQQEGILYPYAENHTISSPGGSAVDSVAAWGTASAQYFREVGTPEARIHVTGSPRHDHVSRATFADEARALALDKDGGGAVLALLTNPIDSQGYCTTEEKYQLTRHFLDRLEPFAREAALHVVVKPHPGEDRAAYHAVADASLLASRTTVLHAASPYALMVAADAVVVLGSTAGLEALMVGTRLGVLPTPGGRFLFDYVDAGVATPITLDDVPGGARELLAGRRDSAAVERYLERHLAHRPFAADRVADVILSTAAHSPAPTR
jgi:hypothetical protein